MKSFCYNIDSACFVAPSGEKLTRCVPELFYQERAEWRIALRGGENSAADLSGIVAWGAAVAAGFDADSAPMCRTLSDGIAADAATGTVTVTLDAATAEFLAAVDGISRKKAFFELYGLNASGERAIHLEFDITARMILDPDPVDQPEVPETLATKNYVTARIGSAVESAYAAASGAIVSGAEFKTSVGDYLLTYTSSGGLMISGGGVSLQVSSGGIVASDADGGRVELASGMATVQIGNGEADSATVTLTSAAANVTVETTTNSASAEITQYGVYVNGRPVLTELVTSTDTTTTSASFPVLSGGTAYVYTQPLTALDITSVADGCRALFKFTAGAGFDLGISSGAEIVGISSYDNGTRYAVAIGDGMAIVNSITIAGA